MNTQKKKRVAVIALDGMTFDLAKPWMEEGHMPNLKKIYDEGVSSELDSCIPALTAPAWVSFMTGSNPGKHGIFDFYDTKQLHGITLYNADDIKMKTLWQYLHDANKKQIVVSVPMTHPLPEVDGMFFAGLSSPVPESRPAEALEQLEKYLDGKYASSPSKVAKGVDWLPELRNNGENKVRTAVQLLKENTDWDFFMIHTQGPDAAHTLWSTLQHGDSEKNTILQLYKDADRLVGAVRDNVPEDTDIIVMSDHGMGPVYGDINLNIYLMKHGIIKVKTGAFLKKAAFYLGLNPKKMYSVASKFKLDKKIAKVSKQQKRKWTTKLLSYSDIDLEKSLCYAKGSFGQIHLNERGIKNAGLTREQAIEKISETLHKLEDENGKKLVSNIQLNENIYTGDCADRGCDMFITFDDYHYTAFSLFASSTKIVSEEIQGERDANHRMEGIFLATGPGFKAGGIKNEKSEIIDLLPTILHLYGEQADSDIDGTVMKDALR